MSRHAKDLLQQAVGWYEPDPDMRDAVSARVRRRARRERAAAVAIAAAVFLLGTVLVVRAFGPSGVTAVGSRDFGSYILSEFKVGPAVDPLTGDEIPGRAVVEYEVSWSTPEYPGDHRCGVTVFDATGAEVGSVAFEHGAMMPRTSSSIEVEVDEAAASATGSCEPERLDTPVAYVISDPKVVPAPDAGVAVAFQVAWPDGLREGEYPSVNACFMDVFAPSGDLFATQFFTLGTGPGRIEQDVSLGPEKRSAIVGQDLSAYSATVRCGPYTAEHVDFPSTESTGPTGVPGAIVTVPETTGLSMREAIRVLENLGLGVEVMEQSADGAEGVVIEQSPSGGTQIEAGAAVTLVVSAPVEDKPVLDYGDVVFEGRTNDCFWSLYVEVITGGSGGAIVTLVAPNGDLLAERIWGTFADSPALLLESFTCKDPQDAVLVFGLAAPHVADIRWLTSPDGSDGGPPDCIRTRLPAGFCFIIEDFNTGGEAIAYDSEGDEVGRATFG